MFNSLYCKILLRTRMVEWNMVKHTQGKKQENESLRSNSPCTLGKNLREAAVGLYKRQVVLTLNALRSRHRLHQEELLSI